MSQLNSEPRPSLGGMCAIDMLLAALGADGRELLDALGVEKVPSRGARHDGRGGGGGPQAPRRGAADALAPPAREAE